MWYYKLFLFDISCGPIIGQHNNSNKLQQYHTLTCNCLVTDRDILHKVIPQFCFKSKSHVTTRNQLLFDHWIWMQSIHKQKKGNLQHGLYCLLACVRGLKDGSEFQQLPECLHNVSTPVWSWPFSVLSLFFLFKLQFWHKCKTNIFEHNLMT